MTKGGNSMNSKKIFGSLLAFLLALTVFIPLNASAATYIAYSERGVKYLAYSKNTITFSTNSTKITASDTEQTHSGLFVRNKGVSKVTSLSSTTKHTYNFKNEFLAGAVLGGVTLGFSQLIVDQGSVTQSGKASWKYDI